MHRLHFDVVILGGGPAGAATALALRSHAPNLSVAIIEQSNYEQTRIGETLPPAAHALLEQLGVWETFLKERHLPAYGTRAVWGSDELFEHEFIYQPAGRGWHLDRKRFDQMLGREAAGRGVTLLCGSKFIDATTLQEAWQLRFSREGREPQELTTAFVVDASGRRAVLATQQRVRKICFDQLIGLFVFFDFDPEQLCNDTYTLVEACEDGWWYSAIVPNGKMAVAFMSDSDIVKKHRLSSLAGWSAHLAQTTQTFARVRKAQAWSEPSAHPSASQRLDRTTGQGWLAVGDAAGTFDPLSSVGIMKALRSGVLAAYAIAEYFQGTSSGLEKYEAILKQEFLNYLERRTDFYRRERRWPTSEFWQRRYDSVTLAERPSTAARSRPPLIMNSSAKLARQPARDNKLAAADRGANHIQPV